METNSSYSRGDKAYRRGFKCLPLDDNVPKRDGFTVEDCVFFMVSDGLRFLRKI